MVLEGAQFTVCPLYGMSKKYTSEVMGTAYRNRIGCDLISIYMLFYIFLLTFPSVACFRCRRYPLYRREREKVFGLNTL